jgi:hypothetical protein
MYSTCCTVQFCILTLGHRLGFILWRRLQVLWCFRVVLWVTPSTCFKQSHGLNASFLIRSAVDMVLFRNYWNDFGEFFSEMHFEFLRSADHDCIKLKIDFIAFQNSSFFSWFSQYVKRRWILIDILHIQFVRHKEQRASFGSVGDAV